MLMMMMQWLVDSGKPNVCLLSSPLYDVLDRTNHFLWDHHHHRHHYFGVDDDDPVAGCFWQTQCLASSLSGSSCQKLQFGELQKSHDDDDGIDGNDDDDDSDDDENNDGNDDDDDDDDDENNDCIDDDDDNDDGKDGRQWGSFWCMCINELEWSAAVPAE